MGNENSVPLVSQFKSLTQAMNGDLEGARQTQIDFIRRAPVVSQLNSMGQAMMGDNDEALRIQQEFAEHNQGVPVLGHMIAAGYAACGQEEAAQKAALLSTFQLFRLLVELIHRKFPLAIQFQKFQKQA